ncbi:uncharacterized protein LOC129599796 [Paramacrobiotus metropolitanus]|uniref:uncharacterized protein LOC129599796 n=1 Tax=Paramacrobiotus metropolitanus TaxID=2943436 RepID=UPI0024458A6C|nr:uncharacterized protein LOC129599796 [Paramacrobiotus metropolitanus]XP_055354095.1 uncharacterized protein LOC129599796 [Paramacrobiotus metropolitanus]XP_055354096.1 uncharacterized protein LOC129599796 [Paramacrobiotus metropolitanus]
MSCGAQRISKWLSSAVMPCRWRCVTPIMDHMPSGRDDCLHRRLGSVYSLSNWTRGLCRSVWWSICGRWSLQLIPLSMRRLFSTKPLDCTIRKFTVPFVNAGRITRLNMTAIRECLDKAAQTTENLPGGSYECYPGNHHVAFRIHVAVRGDFFDFICAQLQDRSVHTRAEWNIDTLTEACASLYPIPDPPLLHDVVIDVPHRSLPFDDGWIGVVVHSVMASVLFSLDLHTQAKARRVCTLWHQLLSERRASRHVALDSSLLKPNELFSENYYTPDCHKIYNFSWALDKAITVETKTLSLFDNLQFTNVTIITKVLVALLTAEGIQLDYILIKDGFSHAGITNSFEHVFDIWIPDPGVHPADRDWKCLSLTKLGAVCRHLVLWNYKVQDIANNMDYVYRYDVGELPPQTLGARCREERVRQAPVTIPYFNATFRRW